MRRRPQSTRRWAALAVGFVMFAGGAGGACAARQAPAPLPSDSPVARAAGLPTIETTDTRLSAAMAALAAGETPAALDAAAREYARLGVFDRAIALLTRAIDLAPASAPWLASRARVWRDWGRPDVALGDAHRAAFLDPSSADAHNTLGTVQFALGQLEDAAASFDRARSLAPDAAWAVSNLCYVALVRGDEAEALARCAEAVARDPSLPAARNNLALVHAAAGRMDEARAVFLSGGDRIAGLYNFGIVLLARRDYAAAAGAFSEACQTAPAFEAACRRAAEARTLGSRGPARKQP